MKARIEDGRHALSRSQIVELRMSTAATIACTSGLVWITQKGQRDDYWLPTGDRMAFAKGAHLVVEAAQDSEISVAQFARASRGRRAAERLRGWRDAVFATATHAAAKHAP
jgi:hypothetical protein